MIVLGLFNGLVFLPVLLVMVGPPSQVEPTGDRDCLPPATPEPSPPRFKLKPHKPKTSRSSEKKEVRSSSKEASCHKPRRHNSEVSLSTIAEENSQYSQSSLSSAGSVDQHEPSSVQTSLNGGTSVFLEPHITVETTTVPANVSRSQCHNHHHHNCRHVLCFASQRVAVTPSLQSTSGGSSRCSSPAGQVTKVTATAKFKLELHTPLESGARPNSRRSRRSSSGSRGGDASTQSSLNSDPLRASGEPNSLASSLSSDGGFSEK